jgi:hypothetical protein
VVKKALAAGDVRTIGTLPVVPTKALANPDVLKKTVNSAIILIKINCHYQGHFLLQSM